MSAAIPIKLAPCGAIRAGAWCSAMTQNGCKHGTAFSAQCAKGSK